MNNPSPLVLLSRVCWLPFFFHLLTTMLCFQKTMLAERAAIRCIPQSTVQTYFHDQQHLATRPTGAKRSTLEWRNAALHFLCESFNRLSTVYPESIIDTCRWLHRKMTWPLMNCKTNDICVRLLNLKANCCTWSPIKRDIKMSTFTSFRPSSVKPRLLGLTWWKPEANDSSRRPWALDNFIYEIVNLPCSDTFTLPCLTWETHSCHSHWAMLMSLPTCIHLTLRR